MKGELENEIQGAGLERICWLEFFIVAYIENERGAKMAQSCGHKKQNKT